MKVCLSNSVISLLFNVFHSSKGPEPLGESIKKAHKKGYLQIDIDEEIRNLSHYFYLRFPS